MVPPPALRGGRSLPESLQNNDIDYDIKSLYSWTLTLTRLYILV